MNQEKFDPHNPKYKKVEDLPQEHQERFVNIPEKEGGGFASKDAVRYLRQAVAVAESINESRAESKRQDAVDKEFLQVPTMEEIRRGLGIPPRPDATPMSVLNQAAKEEDRKRGKKL